jgi:hypothetical protein
MKQVAPSEDAKAARMAMLKVLEGYRDRLTPPEQLAILSYTIGQMIALQDQRSMTGEQAMMLVSQNITQGNEDAIEFILGKPAGRS